MKMVSLVIPTYNEAKNLPLLVEEIFSTVNAREIDLEIIFVDDNSPDGTGQVAEELSQKYPIRVIHRGGKFGLGSAVREGFKLSSRPILGVMDADLSHSPKTINQMISLLDFNDIVLGGRFEKGSTVEQWRWWRKLISKIGVSFTRCLSGVRDPLSGFFFLKRSVIDGVELRSAGYKILLEILVKGKWTKAKEIPFDFRIRKFSTSKLNKMEYWLFFKQFFAYSFLKSTRWLRENKYLAGIMLMAAILLFYCVSYRTFWGDETAVLEYLNQSPGEFLVEYFQMPDNHPPLYYFLVLLAAKILPWTELTIRLVSILAGLGIVALVYKFTYRITLKKRPALLAAIFTALSSYFVLISQMARYHSLAALLALFAIYYFYKLIYTKFSNKTWYCFLAALVLLGYTDYPQFFYAAFVTNTLFLYLLVKRRPITTFFKWVYGQAMVMLLLSPLIWIIYHRIAVQGDGGWEKFNLLNNSWIHKVAAISFHVYSFFFGENIFPWNYAFGIGLFVLASAIVGIVLGARNKMWTVGEKFVIWLCIGLIILNTLFMNTADPRYNFIVYPKYGFVAYPLFIMSVVFCLSKLGSRARQAAFALWGLAALIGLVNFYQAKNYLNPSYFRSFDQFEFVRDHAQRGQYLAITPFAMTGFYHFYKEKYFNVLTPFSLDEMNRAPLQKKSQIWFFAASSEDASGSVAADSAIPAGYEILERYDSVPLDSIFKKYKEIVLGRPSYIYKYGVFLLQKT